ncbi:MAG: M23 family metallopeptidase [Candidatus Buchananbacteria bacterium]
MAIINSKFKRLITGLLAFLVRGIEVFFKGLYILILLLGKALAPIGRVLFKSSFLPLYGRYLIIKNRTSKKTKNLLERVLLAIANKYTIYFVVFIIAIGVVAGNIGPTKNKEDYGQNALIYKIIGFENTEFVEDTYTPTDEGKIYSYFGENSQVESDLFTESQRQEEELYNEQNVGLAMNQDGSTIFKPDIIDTNEARTGSKAVIEYVVSESDTIGRIASKYNISINTILWANNLAATSYIRPGQKLIIPPISGVLYKITRGDTIAKIAQKFDASADTVLAYNNLEERGLIAGQTIMVPGGRIIYTAKPRTTIASSRSNTGTKTYDVDDSSIVSSGKMLWPDGCQRISQYFRGWLHTGVDIACPIGTPIKAADSGVVVRVQYGRTGYGYNVIISHGSGKQTLYGHLSRIDVEAGQKVSRGQQIGLEGSTGRSTGPHLHFEVRINGSTVNPLSYIR